jgi:hypothetical protein
MTELPPDAPRRTPGPARAAPAAPHGSAAANGSDPGRSARGSARSTTGRHIDRPRRHRGRWTIVSAILLAALVGLLGTLLHLLPSSPLAALGHEGAGPGSTTTVPTACPANASLPSAVFEISTPGPAVSPPVGAEVTVTYEVSVASRALGSSVGIAPVQVQLPEVLATFPQVNGTLFNVYTPAQTLGVTNGLWTPATVHPRAIVDPTYFAPGGSAVLSTQLLAVMSTAPLSSVQLEVRWSWSIMGPGDLNSSSTWTVPSASGAFPSVLTPDAYVTLLDHSPAVEAAGASFQAELSGAAALTQFHLKLESASTGATLNIAWFNSSATAGAPFNGSIVLSSGGVPLATGNYLVHVHDACGGILYSLPVQVVAGSTAPELGVTRSL